MKAQSLRGRCTFEMRASSCEEHIQRRVLPQPRRPYVLRRLGSAQKVYHRVRLGQPGGGGGGAAPVAAGARDAARLARAGGAAGRSRVGGDALLGVVARSADRSEEHTSELQSHSDLVCRLLLEKKKRTVEALKYSHIAFSFEQTAR